MDNGTGRILARLSLGIQLFLSRFPKDAYKLYPGTLVVYTTPVVPCMSNCVATAPRPPMQLDKELLTLSLLSTAVVVEHLRVLLCRQELATSACSIILAKSTSAAVEGLHGMCGCTLNTTWPS